MLSTPFDLARHDIPPIVKIDQRPLSSPATATSDASVSKMNGSSFVGTESRGGLSNAPFKAMKANADIVQESQVNPFKIISIARESLVRMEQVCHPDQAREKQWMPQPFWAPLPFQVISDIEKKVAKLSVFAISKALKGIVGEPKSVTKLRSGELLVECCSEAQVKRLGKIDTFVNIPVTVKAHRSLNSSRGVRVRKNTDKREDIRIAPSMDFLY
ncbi:hypothetical protein EGW08_004308 [Elysia chlorotica]|uniref:Uncharacterized protein n=1 Tax=Elysia chlorotica TaxID=188477 RepID=A0A433U244_ELYCH|nr:hypothetical protein EGW08_004308 [Elysia chlorotica]